MRFIYLLSFFISISNVHAAGILSVSPNNADPGATLTVTMSLDSAASPSPPPSDVQPIGMEIGALSGSSLSRSDNDCTAQFTIPADETAGSYDCFVRFNTPNGELTMSLIDGFTVNSSGALEIVSGPAALVVELGDPASFSVLASADDPISYQWQKDGEDISGATAATYTIATTIADDQADYRCVVTTALESLTSESATLTLVDFSQPLARTYTIVDTAQTQHYDNSGETAAVAEGEDFYGQDASYSGNQALYLASDDGLSVYDVNTGLTWTQTPDLDGDGDIDEDDKLTQSEAYAFVANLNANNFGGYSDWRVPSIKEIYSLMDFRGTDPMSDDTSSLIPFIDTSYFDFGYGDVDAGERVIDAQFVTTSNYVDQVFGSQNALFGLNLADGRIKGYPTTLDFYAFFCRGNTDYGSNDFVDNADGTVTDRATGLMWAQADSGSGMLWQAALDYAEGSSLAGYNDWRLPNAKELQSIVDYSRSPETTSSAAIDPIFASTQITNEGGIADYPWYHTGTTHRKQDESGNATVYICFGRAMGYWNNNWVDVHGAGCQRSDDKQVQTSGYTYVTDGWYFTDAPQGDAARFNNFVRLVRDAPEALPEVAISTSEQTVAFDVDTLQVEGSIGDAVTSVTWANAESGGSGMAYLNSGSFTIPSVSLVFGLNTITVTAENVEGDSVSDQVEITRSSSFDGAVIYVDENTPAAISDQNGRSWETAFEDLQDALAVVAADQEIRVADGTYYPDEAAAGFGVVSDDDRSSSFMLPAGASLLGGYAGYGGADPDERGNTSILSGDLDQDDTTEGGLVVADPLNNTRNSNAYTVLTAREISSSESCTLDGFFVTAGCSNSSSSMPIADRHGGGLFCEEASGVLINDCHFIGNYADGEGGALYLDLSEVWVTDCSFLSNSGWSFAGAIQVAEASLFIDRAEFLGNEGEGSGAIRVSSAGIFEMYNSLVAENTAYDGGAITNSGQMYLENCTIAGNTTVELGAGLLAFENTITMLNCIVAGNQTDSETDTAAASCDVLSGDYHITRSLIRGSGGSSAWVSLLGTDGGGNIDVDPLYVDAPNGDYSLDETSPAVNVGTNLLSMDGATDLNGNSRVIAQRVDLGAYETISLQIVDADTDDDGFGDWEELITYGTDPENPDSDYDGQKDGDESIAGTDPTDASSVLSLAMALEENGDLEFGWFGVSGRLYRLYGSDDLTDPDGWTQLGVYLGNGARTVTRSAGDQNSYFYKLVVEISTTTEH